MVKGGLRNLHLSLCLFGKSYLLYRRKMSLTHTSESKVSMYHVNVSITTSDLHLLQQFFSTKLALTKNTHCI